ncbi:hypothetical protein GQ44DRAFT_69379 [Phaeosphaeriaceae sp. PMI808]|nr:hypothetical protein GQ44DRAFT_69379 [Phaeosphaeriaceae sp. PMI808]
MKAFKKFVNKHRQSFQIRKELENNSTATPAKASLINEKRASIQAPVPQQQQVLAEVASGMLQIALQNKSNSNNVYAYITGRAIERDNTPIFVQADGQSLYYPTTPRDTQQPLQADVAIPLGAPGNTVTVTIPKIAGGRIWFSIDSRLTFLLNPGPAVVEPSVTNPSDPNFNINWTFCEFTYNQAQLFANISCVDFISIPIALTLTNAEGRTHSVPGMGADGLQRVVNELRAQAKRDGRPWDKLIYEANGQPLRVLSPNNLLVGNSSAWDGYWNLYTDAVWDKFRREDITINTQAAAGNLTGRIYGDELQLGQAGSFLPPSARDIFSCSTGPFATGSNQARNAVIPRLAAAFNRSTLLSSPGNNFPNGNNPSGYYRDLETTNHYARVVHEVQKDGRGYAFPYDDVVPDGGQDVAGVLFDGNPTLFTVAVGGN